MVAAEVSQRPAENSSPPFSLIQLTCSVARNSVARAGVLYVWSLRELSSAIPRSKNAGTQRSLAAMRSMRSIARGEQAASQSPPSEARHFCGAK